MVIRVARSNRQRVWKAGQIMANAMPWSVRGIDPDIREQAVEAAHRSGLSVGQWLNQVLSGNLDDDRDEDDLPPRARTSKRSRNKSEDLDQRLARIGRGRSDTNADRFNRDDDGNGQHRMMGLLESAISAIERLENNTARNQTSQAELLAPRGDELLGAFRSLEARVQSLAQQATAQPQPQPRSPAFAKNQRIAQDDDPAFSAAIAEIEARRRELDAASPSAGRPASRMVGTMQRRVDEGTRSEMPRHLDEMRQQLDQLVSRIDDLRRDQKPEAARLQDRMDHLAQRIDEWRAHPSAEVALIRRDLASLGAAIEQLSPNRLVGMVEKAMQSIAEKSMRAPRDPMSERLVGAIAAMQDDLRAVMQAVANSRGSDRVAQEIGIVAKRLEEIGQQTPDLSRLDDIMQEADQIKSLIGQAMRAQPLEGLTHQLEALGKEFERFARQPAPLRDDKPVIDAIREVRDRVERIDPAATFVGVEARLASIAAIETRLGALAGIEEKLETIARDVSRLTKDAKPLPQLDSIAARLERIDAVLDGSKAQPLAGLSELTEKLDRLGTSLDQVREPNNEPLVGMLEALAVRIDAVQASRSDQGALDALQDEIARLGTRLEHLSPGTPDLEGVGRTVSQLIAQFDLARDDMRKGATEAAEKAARDAIRSIARDETTDTLAAEGLLLLKRDLGEFKTQQSESERRTRQMLEALHGTLEAVATRLGQMESAGISAKPMPEAVPAQRLAPQVNAVGASPAVAPPAMKPSATAATPDRPQINAIAQREPTPVATQPPREPAKPASMLQSHTRQDSLENEDDPLDLPLEPGVRPGEFVAAGNKSAQPTMSADPRQDFIAAARRAAQAAQQQSQEALAADQLDKQSKGVGAVLRNLLSKKAKPESTLLTPSPEVKRKTRNMAAPVEQEAKQSFLAKQRRPILLGLAALVFALGALKVLTNRNSELPNIDALPPAQTERVMPQSAPDAPPASKPEQQSRAPSGAQTGVDPTRTASIPPVIATTPNGQQVVIPTLNAPQTANAKRAQRLGETSAISQADPITVGSIAADGAARPLETGREALSELATLSGLKGQEKLREAALSGNSAAIFEIGARHADGRGMPRDAKLAARWFEQAAAQGHGPSQYRLASLYREGRGVPKDPALAFQWFDRAAAQGHVLAMHNAAVLLAEGVHGAPDYAGAALWFKRAAEHGVKDSQFNVAILFARGLGVNQDLVESYRWFSAAAAQGDQDAVKKRDDIAARLSKEQLAKERDWLKNFVPTRANPVANEAGNWDIATRAAPAQPQRNSRVN
jgi:localization factor PodJL